MLKRSKSKARKWVCHRICQMHTQSTGSQGPSFHVLRNVRKLSKLLEKTSSLGIDIIYSNLLKNSFGFLALNPTYIINSAPFYLDTFAMEVESGKTYLLRIINAALNDELFFAIAGHNFTVVEVDAVYTKPFTTEAILIAPGQTTNVLVQANQKPGRYFMAARPFNDAPIPVDNKTATGILQYKGIPNSLLPTLAQLPASNDSEFALNYNKKLRSLNSPKFPADVPQKVDRKLFYTIGFGKDSCPTCVNGTRLLATLNNISFVMPQTALLQAHYFNLKGVFKADFPDKPPKPFNYTGAPLTASLGTSRATRLSKIAFNSTIELVLQDTNLLTVESHPFHLHGYNFFVVGTGIGNFDPVKYPANYNLVDPIERNTAAVPTGGWTAIRFRADNPGIHPSFLNFSDSHTHTKKN